MDIETGDIVLTGPGQKATPTLFQHAILTMGGWSTHNEMIYVDATGRTWVASAESGGLKLVDFAERVAECEADKRLMTVARPTLFLSPECAVAHLTYQERMESVIMFACEELRIKYDWRGIITHGRNVIRAFLGWQQIMAQAQGKVWCSEFCEKAMRVCGWNPAAYLPPQTFFAPIHFERLLKSKWLTPVISDP